MDRELVVKYDGLTIGGTSIDYLPDGRYSFGRTRDGGFFEFNFVVVADSASELGKKARAVEETYRRPYKDLSIGFTTGGVYSGAQESNSYLDPMPSIEKEGGPADSARSRGYRARVDYGLPADQNPTPGFRDINVDVTAIPSGRREITISGTTTALEEDQPTNDARDARQVYDDLIDSVASSIFSRLGITEVELVTTDASEDTINVKTLNFERTYMEIIASQGGASLDDPRIIDQQFDIERELTMPGDSQETPFGGGQFNQKARRAAVLTGKYSASIKKGVNPASVYASIRSWMIGQMRSAFGASQIAVITESPEINRDDNTLSASIECMAPVSSSAPITRQVVATQIDTKIDVVRYVRDGTRFGAHTYPRKGELRRITVERTSWTKTVTIPDATSRAARLQSAQTSKSSHDGESGHWTSPDTRFDLQDITFGSQLGSIRGTKLTITTSQVFVATPKKTASSGGPTTGDGPGGQPNPTVPISGGRN